MATTLSTLKSYLKRNPIRNALLIQRGDDELTRVLQAAAQFVGSLSGSSSLDTPQKVLDFDNPLLSECVCMYSSFLLNSTSPSLSSDFNVIDVGSSKSEPLNDFKIGAITNTIQNWLSIGNLREVSNWIDTETKSA